MRRDIGMVLAGLGAFLIVLAIALPTYIAGHVIKFPLNYFYKATLVGTNATYFSASEVKEVTGADINAIYTIKGLGNQGNSSTAAWQLFTYLYDTSLPRAQQAIEIQNQTVAFDRKNAELRNCCGANFMGKKINWTGIVGYVFPMNTQKTTYNVYNTTLMRTVPFTYAGTSNVDGITAYRFVSTVKPVKVGFTPLSATDPEYYGVDQTYYVDPETGALLKVAEIQDAYLINPITGARTNTLLQVSLAPTAASVQDIVNIDNSGRLKILLFETIMPIVVGVLGGIFLVWGVLMARRRPDVTESRFGDSTGELSPAVPPVDPAPATAETAPLPETPASEPAGGRGKHAAGATVNIVPGLEPARAEAEAAPAEPAQAAPESGDARKPETPA
jgi:Porin PorA